MKEPLEEFPYQKNKNLIRNIVSVSIALITLACLVLAFFLPSMQIIAVFLGLNPILAPLVITMIGAVAEILWNVGCVFVDWLGDRNHSLSTELTSEKNPSQSSISIASTRSLTESFSAPLHQTKNQPKPYIDEKLQRFKQILLDIFLAREGLLPKKWPPEKENIIKTLRMQSAKMNEISDDRNAAEQACFVLYTATVNAPDFDQTQEYGLLDSLQGMVDRFLSQGNSPPFAYLSLGIMAEDDQIRITLYVKEELVGRLLELAEKKSKIQEVQTSLKTVAGLDFEIRSAKNDSDYKDGTLFLFRKADSNGGAADAKKVNDLIGNNTRAAKTIQVGDVKGIFIFPEDFDAILSVAKGHKASGLLL
jgi:hypothetical protein